MKRAVNRIAPATKRQRAELVRKANREAEEERMRLAYAKQPDTENSDDDWSNAEKWNA